MKKKFSLENIVRTQIILNNVSAERMDANDSERFVIKRSDKYEILDLNDKTVSLKLVSKVFAEPEILFKICLEYKASFEFNHKIDRAFVEKNIDDILLPLGSDMSYAISTLTKMLVDEYFIMPPIVSIDNE